MQVVIQKTNRKGKKPEAVLDGKKTVPFGQKHASDFTLHKDPERQARYINGHKGVNEDLTTFGINTAGFYSKHGLWNEDTIQKSINDLNKKYKSANFQFEIMIYGNICICGKWMRSVHNEESHQHNIPGTLR